MLLVFALRALQESQPAVTVAVLAEDPALAQLAGSQFGLCAAPTFPAVSCRTLQRAARGALRAALTASGHAHADVLLFTLGESAAAPGGDPYFGTLSDAIRKRASTLTVYLAAGRRLRFNRSLHAIPLEAFLSPMDAACALGAARRNSRRAAGPADDRDQALLAFLRAREAVTGEVFQQRLMARGFERMLARIRPHTLVYPFENRSWEKLLLRAARRGGVQRCIAYQHSSLTPRHWAFAASAAGFAAADLPDRVLTCGEITADQLRRGMPQLAANITVAAALRSQRLDLPPPARAGVLVAISSSRAEAWELLRLTHAAAAHTAEMPFIIRSHPTIPVADLFGQLRWPTNVELSQGRSLAEDLARCSAVAYSSATVALEGMLYGRLPIFLDIGDIPSGDPIDGEYPFRLRATDGEGFAESVRHLLTRPAAQTALLMQQAKAYAERYLCEPTLQRVAAMAEIIAPC